MANQSTETTGKKIKKYDLLIIGGRLLDPKNNIDGIMDIAIHLGRVAQVSGHISRDSAEQLVNAEGMLVCPGLIDMHSHHFFGTSNDYLSNGYCALPPDGFTFRSGVTTALDTGGSGWKNFKEFKSQTIDRSKTRVLALLNIIGSGMKGGDIEQNLEDMDPEATAAMAARHPGVIVGIKLAHFLGPDWTPTERTVAAGEKAGLPVMIDFGRSEPKLPLETLFMEKLRPGDIFTHCYADVEGREALVDEHGKLKKYVTGAREKGIIFDLGHGEASFRFDQAVPAIAQGFLSDTISTDLHTGCMNAGMKDMPNLMSKCLAMGIPIAEIIRRVSWNPAQVLGRTELGHLSEGTEADLVVFSLRDGEFGFVDAVGKRLGGTKKFECELTVRGGEVVYDLNGLTAKGEIMAEDFGIREERKSKNIQI